MPDPTNAWKPEIAPQAIVNDTNGHTGPATIGPPPFKKSGIIAGNWIVGLMINTPIINAINTPIYIKLDK